MIRYFQNILTKQVFDVYIMYNVPDQGVGCQCWNTLREHNMADVWTDGQKSLETIEGEGVTEIVL